jgi:hypothetical protein
MNLIKLFIASIRWGELSPSDVELVESSTLKQVFQASYLRRTISSPRNIVVLEK